jgi:hypothetical protein
MGTTNIGCRSESCQSISRFTMFSIAVKTAWLVPTAVWTIALKVLNSLALKFFNKPKARKVPASDSESRGGGNALAHRMARSGEVRGTLG